MLSWQAQWIFAFCAHVLSSQLSTAVSLVFTLFHFTYHFYSKQLLIYLFAMCLPTNTTRPRIALAEGQSYMQQAERNNIVNTIMISGGMRSTTTWAKCEAPKRRGNIHTMLDLSMVSGGNQCAEKSEPPKRLESMSSDYSSDTTESSSTFSNYRFSADLATEFLRKSNDQRLRMLKRHVDIHG